MFAGNIEDDSLCGIRIGCSVNMYTEVFEILEQSCQMFVNLIERFPADFPCFRPQGEWCRSRLEGMCALVGEFACSRMKGLLQRDID